MDMDIRGELAEATGMLELAKGPRVQAALTALVASLQATLDASLKQAVPITPTPTQPATSVSATAESLPTPTKNVPSSGEKSRVREQNGTAASHPPTQSTSSSSAKETVAPPPTRVATGVPAETRAADTKYLAFDRFAWDQGAYNSPKISIYVPLDGVGAIKERVKCSFSTRGFDLTVVDFSGKNYRLLQNNLEKDIIVGESSILVKRNKIIVKLQKLKGDYGSYDHWNSLTAKKSRPANKTDPSTGIMDMMKDMYDEGDDNMKKIIGEAMLKSRNQEKPSEQSYSAPSHNSDKPFESGLDDMDDDFGLGDYGSNTKNSASSGEEDDDFGFGSVTPPPGADDPVPAAVDDDDEEEEEEVGGEVHAAEQTSVTTEATATAAPVGSAPESDTNILEALDD